MKRRKITPPVYIPKFKEGDRVRLSAEGVKWLIGSEGMMGTVEYCGLVVRVLIDGKPNAQFYSTDYWDAVPQIEGEQR